MKFKYWRGGYIIISGEEGDGRGRERGQSDGKTGENATPIRILHNAAGHLLGQ